MKKKVIITILVLILLAVIFLPSVVNSLTIEPINKYTYTKALCTDTNFCQDHIIACENKQVVSITPISGATIQNSDDWVDPRGEQARILCE